MSRSVRSSLLAGGLLAFVAFLLVDHGSHLGSEVVGFAVLGLTLGAAVALVPDRELGWRAGAFVAGLLFAWLGFALRAQFLPAIPLGRAISAAVVIGLVTGVTALSFGRMPVWAGLVGVGAFSGAYEATFDAAPTAFLHDSYVALAAVGLSASIGFLVGSLVVPAPAGQVEEPPAAITIPEPGQTAVAIPNHPGDLVVPDHPGALVAPDEGLHIMRPKDGAS